MDGFTLGTVLVGTAPLAYVVSDWYPGLKRIQSRPLDCAADLAPFLLSWCVGALMVMCVGGLVGLLTDWVLWGAGWLGDAVLIWGVGGRRVESPTGVAAPLTQGGLFVTVIVLAVWFGRAGKGRSRDKKLGLLSGVCMGMSAGATRLLAVPLASAVNIAGGWYTGLIT